MTAKILAAGAIAGLVANITGYLITGMLFHRYQARTPGTWRASESWAHYMVSMAIRIFACIAIGLVYAGLIVVLGIGMAQTHILVSAGHSFRVI